MNNDPIRAAFEKTCVPNFGLLSLATERKSNGEYLMTIVEDHWQTFQEGWEEAILHLQKKDNPCYTDIVSNGGMDPRKV